MIEIIDPSHFRMNLPLMQHCLALVMLKDQELAATISFVSRRGGCRGEGGRDQGDQSFISIAATQCVENLGFVLCSDYVKV